MPAIAQVHALHLSGVALVILWFPAFLTHDPTALCTLEPSD